MTPELREIMSRQAISRLMAITKPTTTGGPNDADLWAEFEAFWANASAPTRSLAQKYISDSIEDSLRLLLITLRMTPQAASTGPGMKQDQGLSSSRSHPFPTPKSAVHQSPCELKRKAP